MTATPGTPPVRSRLGHPQISVLWLAPVLMGATALAIAIDRAGPPVLPHVLIAGVVGLSFPRLLSHHPFPDGRSARYAALQGLWFGLFLANIQLDASAPAWVFWLTLAIGGGIYGAFHYLLLTGREMRHAGGITAHFGEISGTGPLVSFWPLVVLGLGGVASVPGAGASWPLLVMAIALCGTPWRRRLRPDQDIRPLGIALSGLAVLMAGGAAVLLAGR